MTENVLLKAFSNFEVLPVVKKWDHSSVLKKQHTEFTISTKIQYQFRNIY